ncbi:MAG TPA: caspase family protein [Thermoanaerobaculia bacterium]
MQAADVPTLPSLRIETAMHTATISRIAADAGGRFVVTGSWDKTVRLWELRSGRLLRTIHLPAGSGNEGQVYALAITPNGQTIAAGGWTGWDWEGTASIYLFDRKTGRLERRISGLPGRPVRLAYSPDGRWLAAGLRGANGLRLFDESGKLAANDRDYGDDCGGVAFGAGGKLVTSSRDGFLRLYALPAAGQPLRQIAKQRSDGGLRPFGVSFSPDGRRIAVGFDDTAGVAVLSGADLSPVFRADTATVANGNLASVAWSWDGAQLCAGGMSADRQASRFVRIWSQQGKGVWRDVQVAADTIMDIAPLPAGGFVFAAADPAWGRVSPAGERQFVVGSAIADYRGERDELVVSADGLTVQFQFRLGESPARYSVAERVLELSPPKSGSFHRPRIAAPGVSLEHWKNSPAPELNGRPLALDRDDEIVRSEAMPEDGACVLIGTDWNLDLFNREGVRRWSVPAPDSVWAVNLSEDASLAVAAFGDGTIRWYRLRDGQELFSLFPDPSGKWILWTAEGYYDCSPGAEELIGWSVNHGKEHAADFFRVSHFRSRFYRPDLIAQLAATRDRIEALRMVDAPAIQGSADIARLAPPVVEIMSPDDGMNVTSRDIALFYDIRVPSGEPLTSVRVLVNGRPVPAKTAGDSRNALEGELTISIPPEDVEVTLIAANRFSASDPATRRFYWAGPKVAEATKSALYVLAIGVGRFADADAAPALNFAGRDAQAFTAVLRPQKGLLYATIEAKTLSDRQATREAVQQAFDWLRAKPLNASDTVIVFIAGHGATTGGQYYFLPYDADARNLAATAISGSAIEEAIGAVPARAMLFLDTCHAGTVFGGRLAGDLNGAINRFSSPEQGIVVFAASTGTQSSQENEVWGNGAFTKAVVEGLRGRAGRGEGQEITVAALESYVSQRVRQLTGGQQTPTTAKPRTVPDYPIAMQTQ